MFCLILVNEYLQKSKHFSYPLPAPLVSHNWHAPAPSWAYSRKRIWGSSNHRTTAIISRFVSRQSRVTAMSITSCLPSFDTQMCNSCRIVYLELTSQTA
jgi:hypothetical protein